MAVRPWLERLRNKLSSSNPRRRQRRSPMGAVRSQFPESIDRLEDRTLLSATVQFGVGRLQILSDAGEDIAVREDPARPGNVDIEIDGAVITSLPNLQASQVTSLIVTTGSGDNVVDLSGVSATAFTSLTSIVVTTRNGNDTITGSPDFANSIIAGDGEDVLIGGDLADTLDGGDGDDTLIGGLGDDSLVADDGNDSLRGGGGNDSVLGGDGNDTLDGGDGDDVVTSGDGSDNAHGGDGNDTLNGNSGPDTLIGTARGTLTITSTAANQSVTFEEREADTDTISVGFVNAATMSGTTVASVTGVGTGSVTITIELGDDGMALTANGSDIVAAIAADAEAGAIVEATVAGPDETFGTAAAAALTFTSMGTNDDFVLGGGGNDLLFGAEGNDTLLGNGGNDTLIGNDGDDSLGGHNGNDSLLGSAGNDRLSGNGGNDTLDGEAGDDVILGGSGNDLAFGDGQAVATATRGDDSIRGQGGDDTIIGVFGQDTLLGGAGDDLIRSTLEEANVVPPAPSPPSAPTAAATGLIQALTPAVASGGVVGPQPNPATLTNGSGNGDILVGGLDAAGDFNFGQSIFNPISPAIAAVSGIIFNSDIYLRVGSSGPRTQLMSGNAINGTTSELLSNFTSSGLDVDLVQSIDVLNDFSGSRIGSQITQTYSVTNTTSSTLTFEFVRYNEAHAFNFGGSGDGGGRFQDPNGVDIFFESSGNVTPGNPVTFVGITGIGGDVVSTNRFEFGPFASTIGTIASGAALSDTFNSFTGLADTDGDGFVDVPTGDSEIALRNVFTLAPGDTTSYTTHTLFGTLIVQGINQPPVGTADFGSTFGGNPVTLDVVSNDMDPDGVLDFSSVTIVGPPASGSAVSLGDGRVTYTPDPSFSGPVAFSYTIADNEGAVSLPVTVTIDVIAADVLGDVIDGARGNDTVFASDGDDLITAGPNDDVIDAGDGNDTVFGGGGDDSLIGADGNDSLIGQGGDDTLDGGDGEDILRWDGLGDGHDLARGGAGSNLADVRMSSASNSVEIGQDALGRLTVREGTALFMIDNATITQVNVNTGAGADRITVDDLHLVGSMRVVVDANVGNDIIDAQGAILGSARLELFGGDGNDTIGGGAGNDRLFGGDGDDVIRGRSGADTIFGDAGADLIIAGAANDSVNGGTDDDTIMGGNGDDRLDGGADSDQVDGGLGDDTLLGGLGDDIINGMDGDDSLLGGEGLDMVLGGSGHDTLDGGRNDDTLLGNSGNDLIRGNHGNDSIMGEEGDDEIVGGDGNDTIFGGDGDDGIAGNDGDDLLDGELGRDTIRGNDGDDTIRGGGGRDTLVGDQGIDAINGNGGNDLASTGEGLDPGPIRVEVIDESFVLTSRMLENLDGV